MQPKRLDWVQGENYVAFLKPGCERQEIFFNRLKEKMKKTFFSKKKLYLSLSLLWFDNCKVAQYKLVKINGINAAIFLDKSFLSHC